MRPRASVVIRSKDEADRLRLTLASLPARANVPKWWWSMMARRMMRKTSLLKPGGTLISSLCITSPLSDDAAASNAGAAAGAGDIVLFLDGDTLADPRSGGRASAAAQRAYTPCRAWLDASSALHAAVSRSRGGYASGGAGAASCAYDCVRNSPRATVTRVQIGGAFHEIERRGQPGIYPGFGPRRLYELEMDALTNAMDCSVLWAAASGSNQSLGRRAFLDIGGFQLDISTNEHRELALRLCQNGFAMVGSTARTYHMTHRSGWRDPLENTDWEDIFFKAHPIAAVALLRVLWAKLLMSSPSPRRRASGRCQNWLPPLNAARCSKAVKRCARRIFAGPKLGALS